MKIFTGPPVAGIPVISTTTASGSLTALTTALAGVEKSKDGATSDTPLIQPSLTVSSASAPIPGYLVQKIALLQYVDFVLLCPSNLDKLPQAEVTGAQNTRFVKQNLSPIRSFINWVEAWSMFAGVMAKKHPEKLPDLICYFLLLSKASRDIAGTGWLDYDKAFRQQAAQSKAEPTLWVSLMIPRGIPRATSASNTAAPTGFSKREDRAVCKLWNLQSCHFNPYRYLGDLNPPMTAEDLKPSQSLNADGNTRNKMLRDVGIRCYEQLI